MNPVVIARLQRTRRRLAWGAGACAVAAALLGFFAPAALAPAARWASLVCLAPAVGSLLFSLIHRLTGGEWGERLAPFFTAGVALAPWAGLAVGCVALATPGPAAPWPAYSSGPMIAGRGLVGALVLLVLSSRLRRGGAPRAPRVGPAGLIVLVFALHLLADDWLVALEPGWHSTAFPVVWMAGQAVTGLAAAIAVAIACEQSPDGATGLDCGNLLLAALCFWSYVAFAQYLIIWAGNLPREIAWYVHRSRGAWSLVPALLAAFHFVVPLGILLSHRAKRSALRLGFAAGVLLAAQALFLAWIILPAFPPLTPAGGGFAVALAGAAGGLCGERYLAGVQRGLASS